jgi:hypothetical protein
VLQKIACAPINIARLQLGKLPGSHWQRARPSHSLALRLSISPGRQLQKLGNEVLIKASSAEFTLNKLAGFGAVIVGHA